MKTVLKLAAIVCGVMTMACKTQTTVGDFSTYPEYKKNDLGLTYNPQRSTLRLWAPSAEKVTLRIYNEGVGGEALEVLEMTKSTKGTWVATLEGDRKGQFYTYQVTTNGKTLDETPGVWTKAVGVNGQRAAIIDLNDTDPEGWAEDKRVEVENYTDIIIYEMHHRDFSSPRTAASPTRVSS